MGSMWSGFLAIKLAASTRQSKHATSKNTKPMFMILMYDGTAVIKTAATTRQRKHTTSDNTNESYTHYKNQFNTRLRQSQTNTNYDKINTKH